MRTIKELLQLIADTQKGKGNYYNGICHVKIQLWIREKITDEENDLLSNFLYDEGMKRREQGKVFYNTFGGPDRLGAYWFKGGNWRGRRKWLKETIESL